MATSLTREFAELLVVLGDEDPATADMDSVRLLLLDHLGVAACGAATDSATAARRALWRTWGEGGQPVPGAGERMPPLGAAMATAVAAHSIEFDDTHSAASSHPGVVVFPAALAAAALTGADAPEVLRAVVVGYEAMCRVGRAVDPASHYAAHYHPTATTGHFGSAAAAATLLRLDAASLTAAFGIAATMAAGSMEFLTDGAWTKRWHPAVAARNGVEAALLAAEGYVGPSDGLGGSRGFFAAYSDGADPTRLFADWGSRPLEVRATSIKAHACCRYNQGAVDALLDIRGRLPDAPDVERIVIGLPTVAIDIVARPEAVKRRPASVVDAQFSMPYAAAVALRHGKAGLAEYEPERVGDPTLHDLIDRVDVVGDPDLDVHYPEQWRAWARVEVADGTALEARVTDPKGDPANPFSIAELRAKFVDLTRGVYSAGRQHELVQWTERFGEPGSLAGLMKVLPTDT